MATLRVFRWSEGSAERFDDFEVTAGPETTVLDALVETQRSRDSTLAFRYACRVGMCGSCAMVVNGRERWACRTRLVSLDTGAVTVRPLYHLPLIRDLVVDMTPFRTRMNAVGGALAPFERGGPATEDPHTPSRAISLSFPRCTFSPWGLGVRGTSFTNRTPRGIL